jgi:hypothetical protein
MFVVIYGSFFSYVHNVEITITQNLFKDEEKKSKKGNKTPRRGSWHWRRRRWPMRSINA